MALDRTNMVSLLDIGSLMGGTSANIVELGNGFTELSEDWGPKVESKQYVNMKNASNSVLGYEFSMDAEREYISDTVQAKIDDMFKKFPTGSDCETSYYRFYKSDLTKSGETMTGDCIKLPVVVSPSSTGGAGGDTLTSSIGLAGNGEVELGTITISSTGTYTWAAKS